MKPVVIVGSGQAGLSVAREIRTHSHTVPVVLLSKESICAYYKPNLSKALSLGKSVESLRMKSQEQLQEELHIQMVGQAEVTEIKPTARTLSYVDNAGVTQELAYQALVLATGASAITLPISSDIAPPLFTINSLDEYGQFRQQLGPQDRVLIIGAGFVGTELASDLNASGHAVTVVDTAQWPLNRVIPDTLGSTIRREMTEAGVQWRFGLSVEHLCTEDDCHIATLSDGSRIHCDLVVSAVGLRPNLQLAEQTGIECDKGILVDTFSETSVPGIYALGDCAQYDSGLLPFIAPITQAAKALGKTLAGLPTQLAFPPLAVPVKIAACPTVISPPVSGKGVWEVKGTGSDLEAHFVDAQGNLLGFALTGQAVSQKSELAKRCQRHRITRTLPSPSSSSAA